METCIDFLQCLETDMVLNIFKCLDDPADLVRTSLVSQYWRDFVVANGLSKQLCVAMFPQLSNIVDVTEPDCKARKLKDVGSSKSAEWDILERDHKVYSSLLQTLTKLKSSPIDCILVAVSASSTDNYPDESIRNTLDPRDRFPRRASYWSSKGQKDRTVPETLIYKLKAELCLITEIDIQPFEAFFQDGDPIYSAKSVRFRMGHPINPSEIESDPSNFPLQQPADDKFIWTYTSQEFAMTQENRLQPFKLPEPVICIGGFLQIELLGRIQRQEMDGLFYICISHVKVLGRPLSPAYDIEILEPSGKFSLKYFHDALHTLHSSPNGKEPETASVHPTYERLWRHISLVHFLVGENQQENEVMDWDDDEIDMD